MLKACLALLVVSCAVFLPTAEASLSQEVKTATNQFSLDLLKAVLEDNAGNAVVSPVSVYTLLAVLQQGTGGTTRTEVNNLVHAEPEETRSNYRNLTAHYKRSFPRLELEFSTRAFAAPTFEFKSDFKQNLVGDFQSGIDTVDFANPENATAFVNNWVSQSTHQKINQLFQSSDLSEDTALVLVNALYFKTYWDNPFHRVQNKTFSPSNGVEFEVLTLGHTNVYYGGECGCIGIKYVHLDFVGTSDFTVMLVLPTERHGLNTLVEKITAQNLTNIISTTAQKRVTLQFPKFRLNSDSQLAPILRKLGLNQVFEDNADLSGMTNQPIKLSKVIQKAEIQADEGGVTAAAATGFTFHYLSARQYPTVDDMDFIADHPFLFFIVDRINHVPLFAGRVTNPTLG